MKKKLLLLGLMILFSASFAGAQVTTSCGNSPCSPITASGGTLTVTNIWGGSNAALEYLFSGSPATASITVQGCMRGGTCDTAADTYGATTNTIRGITFSKPYGYFLITFTYTGGTNVSLQVNPVVSSGAGGSASVTVTGNVNTQPAGFASIVAFQQAVTASAVVLATNAVHGFCVKALPNNALTVYVGPSGVSTATGYPLAPGDSICYQGSNTNLGFVISSNTGSSVAVSGN